MKIALGTGDTRATVEKFLAALREGFVFDNVALYLYDDKTSGLEIVYARAVGRAKNAEADAAWGEMFAGQVLAKKTLLMQEPEPGAPKDD
ncbi:MAG TPA: hypothetical protein VG324_00475, partial [Blastocatellia bacterium]|nr:hypothetical protein [Blastocatellia bacterium]